MALRMSVGVLALAFAGGALAAPRAVVTVAPNPDQTAPRQLPGLRTTVTVDGRPIDVVAQKPQDVEGVVERIHELCHSPSKHHYPELCGSHERNSPKKQGSTPKKTRKPIQQTWNATSVAYGTAKASQKPKSSPKSSPKSTDIGPTWEKPGLTKNTALTSAPTPTNGVKKQASTTSEKAPRSTPRKKTPISAKSGGPNTKKSFSKSQSTVKKTFTLALSRTTVRQASKTATTSAPRPKQTRPVSVSKASSKSTTQSPVVSTVSKSRPTSNKTLSSTRQTPNLPSKNRSQKSQKKSRPNPTPTSFKNSTSLSARPNKTLPAASVTGKPVIKSSAIMNSTLVAGQKSKSKLSLTKPYSPTTLASQNTRSSYNILKTSPASGAAKPKAKPTHHRVKPQKSASRTSSAASAPNTLLPKKYKHSPSWNSTSDKTYKSSQGPTVPRNQTVGTGKPLKPTTREAGQKPTHQGTNEGKSEHIDGEKLVEAVAGEMKTKARLISTPGSSQLVGRRPKPLDAEIEVLLEDGWGLAARSTDTNFDTEAQQIQGGLHAERHGKGLTTRSVNSSIETGFKTGAATGAALEASAPQPTACTVYARVFSGLHNNIVSKVFTATKTVTRTYNCGRCGASGTVLPIYISASRPAIKPTKTVTAKGFYTDVVRVCATPTAT